LGFVVQHSHIRCITNLTFNNAGSPYSDILGAAQDGTA
jgi:hypothetical protein